MKLRREQMDALAEVQGRQRRAQYARKWAESRPNARLDPESGTVHESTSDGLEQTARFGPHGLVELDTFGGRHYRLRHDDEGHIVEASVSSGTSAPDVLHYRMRYGEAGEPSELCRGSDRVLALRAATGLSEDRYGLEVEYGDGAIERLEYEDGVLARAVDAVGGVLAIERDAQGAVRRVVDPRGHATEFERDPLDPAGVTLVHADGARETFRSVGDDAQSVHLDGELLGRVHGEGDREYVIFADEHTVEIEWDGERPLRGSNDTTTVAFEYDASGRLQSEQQGQTRIQYRYDDAGNLTAIETSDGQLQEFEWDADGYLSRATDGGGEAFDFEYDAAGLMTRLHSPNGVETRARLELGARRSESRVPERSTPVDVASLVTTVPGAAEPILTQELALNLRGQILYARIGEEQRAYDYDPAGRLVESFDPDSERRQTYAWDASGNRVGIGTEVARFDVRNRIESQGSDVFRHDAQGRLVARSGRTTASYRYDGQGHLREVRGAAGSIASYAYDAFGRRIRKTCGDRVTHFLWAGRQLLREVTFEAGRQIERRDYLCVPAERHPLGVRIDGELHCYHLDSTGTPLALTNARAQVVWQGRYDDFGRVVEEQGTVRQPLRHLGQYCDLESGLHYNLFRYYDPRLGRYLTPDPLRFRSGSHNFYTYAHGDPINQRDRDGHLVFLAALAVIGVAAVVGGLIGGAVAAATAEEGKRAAAFAKGFGWGALAGAVGAAVPIAGAALGAGTAAIAAASLAADGIVSGVEACSDGGWSTATFAKAAAISVGTTIATAGLARIPAVKRGVAALGSKLKPAQDSIGEGLSSAWNRIKAPFRRSPDVTPTPSASAASRPHGASALPDPETPHVNPKDVKKQDTKCKTDGGDPVDLASGQVWVSQNDFVLRGPIPLDWRRYYSSGSRRMGVCGFGWDTPGDTRIELSETGEARFYDGAQGACVFPSLPFVGRVREWTAGGSLTREVDRLVVTQPNGLRYVFPAAKRGDRELAIERIEDRFGNRIEFERSNEGLTALVESSGRRLAIESRDGLVRALRLESADRRESRLVVRYEYDDLGNLSAAIDPLGQRYSFGYEEHRIVERRDPLGRSFHYEYESESESDSKGDSRSGSEAERESDDGLERRQPRALESAAALDDSRASLAQRRCIRTRASDGTLDYRFEYTEQPPATRYTDSLGHVWISERDASGFIVAEVDPEGGRTEYRYDKAGRTIARIDPAGNVTTWEYDDDGNVLREITADGAVHRYAYAGAGRLGEYTDPAGRTWRQEWDLDGCLARRIAPDGSAWTLAYDTRGNLKRVSNPLGHAQTFEYDERGRLIARRLAGGGTWTYRYDLAGNPIEVCDPLGARTKLDYDLLDRLCARVDATGAREELRYDGAGNLSLHRNAEGHETRFEYSTLDELSRKILPDGTRVEYAYDTEGRLSGVQDRKGRSYRLIRDALGRVIEEIDYWGARRQYGFDAAGFLVSKRDELDRESQFTCDPLGRLLERVTQDGTESFVYDATGNLVQAENATGSVTRHYDALDRLTLEEQPNGHVRYAYDEAGHLIERSSSLGHRIRYAWDPDDALAEVRIDDRSPIRIERDSAGRATREWLASGLSRSFRHDPVGRLLFQELRAHGTPLGSRSYRYGATGELAEWSDGSGRTVQLRYDPLGELASFRLPGTPFDDALPGLDEHPGEGDVARVWSRRGVDFAFDQAGQLRSRSSRGRHLELDWDASGHLHAAHPTHAESVTYAYDAFARRAQKCVGTAETRFLWDGPRLLGERRPDGSHREYVFYPGTFIPLAAVEDASETLFYTTDPVGLPHEVFNSRGHTLWRGEYDGAGRLRTEPVQRIDQPLRFQGQYHDAETGLRYNLHRYYDPDLGHFISKDPLGLAASEDLYAYAPNPWTWIDPWGLVKDEAYGQLRHGDPAIRTGWSPGKNDVDWRGSGKTTRDALEHAFERTGVPRSEFTPTKWAKDKDGKSFPVEYRSSGGAEVNIDIGHTQNGPGVPHVGWQTPGKRTTGGGARGHILLDDVPYNR